MLECTAAANSITQYYATTQAVNRSISSYSKDIKLKIHKHVLIGRRNVHPKNENCISIICRDMTILNFYYF